MNKHLSALDGLRGFAALLVVVSHSANAGFLPKELGAGLGQMGVTLFFGLSGFLMAYLYCQKQFDAQGVWGYVINRLTRILPLYYAVVTFTAACLLVFNLELLGTANLQHIAENMLFLRGTTILWTIPVEVHFYAVFVALWFASTQGNFTKSVIVLAIVQIFIVAALGFSGRIFPILLISWLHVFLFGALLGGNYEQIKSRIEGANFKPHLSVAAWLVFLLAIIAPPQLRRELGLETLPNFIDPITMGYPLAVLTCTVFLLGPFSLFRQTILRWYGKISYSLYLLHMFAVYVVNKLVSEELLPLFLAFPIVLGLATVMATASFYGFERPAQKMLRKLLGRKLEASKFGH